MPKLKQEETAPMLIDQINDVPHADEKAFAAIRDSGCPVALFGAGDMALYNAAYLRGRGIEPVFVCDNDPARRGMLHAGIPIGSYEQFKAKMSTAKYHIVVAVGEAHRDTIYAQLAAAGEKNPIWYLCGYELCGPKMDFSYFRDNIRLFEEAYSALADDFSRKVFVNVLNAKLTGDFSLYREIRSGNLYFDKDLIAFGEHEVFLDVGAYKGDAIVEFARRTGGKYDGIIAFEPDRGTADILKTAAAQNGVRGLEMYNCGAWNKHALLRFDDGREGSSRIYEPADAAASAASIEVNPIDDILRERRVTYIAMDIEGAEHNAILGAERTIKKWKPRMAVCVYHKREDLFDILLLLKSFVPQYKFHMRHYTDNQTETVLYAL